MNYPENIKKRILLVISAIAAYIFLPVLIGTPIFSVFSPTSFSIAGIFVHGMQVFVFLILLYGSLAWVKPSLVPQTVSKKIIYGIICALTILSVIPAGLLSLESVGSCTIIHNSLEGKNLSNNGQSTEQECIESCIRAGDENIRVNQISCEFVGSGKSWFKNPDELKGYKPNI